MKTLLMSLIFWGCWAHANPLNLTYQGRIVKADGTPLEYNNVSFLFEIANPNGSCVVYREQVDGVNMASSKGVFDVPIGLGTRLFPTGPVYKFSTSFDNSTVHNCYGGSTYTPLEDDNRVLKVQFHDGTGWKQINPSNMIRSVPYALSALSATKLGNLGVGDFLLKTNLPGASCGAGNVITFDGTNFHCVVDAGGSGVVSDVLAGTGMNVTGTSTKTVSISTNGVSANELASNSVITNKIADGNVTGPKLETLAGLTAGSYGSATVVPSVTVDTKGRVTAITTNAITGLLPAASGFGGKYLKSDGTSWSAQDIKFNDIKNSIGASAFNTGVCAANQTVKWSALTDMFECQNIGSLDASAISSGTISAARLPPSASMWQDGGAGAIYYNSGNVGVGTASPSAPLHVSKDQAGTTTALVSNWDASAGSSAQLKIASDMNSLFLRMSSFATANSGQQKADGAIIEAGGSGGLSVTASYSGSGIRFYTAGSADANQRMVINSTGNVGIGTTSPQAKLDVNGAIRATDICDETGANCKDISSGWSAGGSVTSVATGTGLTGGPITTSGTISIAAGGVSATELATNAVTTVKIADGNVTGAKLETLAGLTAGAYGTATSIPSITIDTKGRVTAITTNNITGLLPTAAGAGGKFLKSDETSWSGDFVKFSDVKNSVGTSAFNLAGCSANQTVAWSSLTDMFTCQSIGSLDAAAITTGTISTARLPAGASMWQDGGAGKIYYNSGNVGIGTSSPRSSLDVNGGIRAIPGAPANDSANAGYSFGANGDTGMFLVNNTGPADGDIMFYSNANPKMTITYNNVGIGTTSPVSKLNVHGTHGNAAISTITATGTSSQMNMGLRYGAVDNAWIDAPSSALVLNPGGGNVGIGTPSPSGSLEVVGGSAFFTRSQNDQWGSNFVVRKDRAGAIVQSTDEIGYINFAAYDGAAYRTAASVAAQVDGTPGSNDMPTRLVFATTPDGSGAAVERVRITNSGNVGIGTASPRGGLDVSNGAFLLKAAVSNATSIIDFSTGNLQYTASDCGNFQFNNMKDGGSYTFVVKGATSATCAFTAFSDSGSSGLTVHMPPGHAATTASKHTLYSLLVMGTDLYVSWIPGY
ncbi:beta strand repeat-containing protein [Bdellovibrio sp. HCB-162]|uniref:beta strand repeat-containing protein n=1 Tax=Bdellovibrio sp. HCB-162 TaxID=3394234 RepID=UPI0039BCDBA6